MLSLLPSPLSAQPILMESALVLQAPGHRGIVPSWFDGDRFWIHPQPFMELLDYEILVSDSTELVARDRHHAFTFAYSEARILVNGEERYGGDFAMAGPDGQMMITVEALQQTFGPDLVWDLSSLTLTLSSAASQFDATRFGERQILDMEAPQNVLFPSERTWLGGVHIGYAVMHEWHASTGRSITPVGRIAAHVVGGTVRWHVGNQVSRIRYTLPLSFPWLTQISAGQLGGGLGVQMSNRPLHSRQVHREEMQRGRTLPHAIVRGRVSGAVSEQVQADTEGRYAIRHPVFYGSTETSIEVQPLGGEAEEVFTTHWLTPYTMLPRGHVEYDMQISATPSGEFGWGLTSRLTLQASVAHSPRKATVRVLALPLSTMNLDAEVDLMERSVLAKIQWWRPWGGVDGAVDLQQKPAPRQLYSASFALSTGGVWLHTHLTHQRTGAQLHNSTLHSTLGWQIIQHLSVETGMQVQRGGTEPARISPRLTYTLPLSRPRIHLQASAKVIRRRLESWRGGAWANGRAWSSGIQFGRSVQSGQMEARGTLQLNTDWAWFDALGGWRGGEFYHSQTLRGTILIGEDIRFAALFEERTQAVIRLFLDANLNGVLDGDEQLSLGHRLTVSTNTTAHRANGEVVAPNLNPYHTYMVSIIPSSIKAPLLRPATGYRFAFVATPGRTRYIDVPLQPLPTVTGRLTDWIGSYTALQVRLHRGEHTEELAVYQDGMFVTQVLPGNYEVVIINRITGELVGEATVSVGMEGNFPVISLQP